MKVVTRVQFAQECIVGVRLKRSDGLAQLAVHGGAARVRAAAVPVLAVAVLAARGMAAVPHHLELEHGLHRAERPVGLVDGAVAAAGDVRVATLAELGARPPPVLLACG